jgi:chemotaxis protein CheD
MNHILHSGEGTVTADDSARYGINAMEILINEMAGLGAVRSRLVAKIFGGGNILDLPEKYQVGVRNTDFVINFLKTDKIRVLAQNTGGHFSRKLLFHTDTCEALMKKET